MLFVQPQSRVMSLFHREKSTLSMVQKWFFMVQTDSPPAAKLPPSCNGCLVFFFKAVRNAAFQTALAPRLTLWRCPPFFAGLEERVSNQKNNGTAASNERLAPKLAWINLQYTYPPGTQMTLILIGVWAFFWKVVSPQNSGQTSSRYTYFYESYKGSFGIFGFKGESPKQFCQGKTKNTHTHTHHESMSQFAWSLPSSVESVEHISLLAKFLQSLEHDVLLLAKICLICFKKSKYKNPWSNQDWMGCVKIRDPNKNHCVHRIFGFPNFGNYV